MISSSTVLIFRVPSHLLSTRQNSIKTSHLYTVSYFFINSIFYFNKFVFSAFNQLITFFLYRSSQHRTNWNGCIPFFDLDVSVRTLILKKIRSTNLHYSCDNHRIYSRDSIESMKCKEPPEHHTGKHFVPFHIQGHVYDLMMVSLMTIPSASSIGFIHAVFIWFTTKNGEGIFLAVRKDLHFHEFGEI